MVDRRYRIACVAVAFLHASPGTLWPRTLPILLCGHDFGRKIYHAVEDLASADGHSGGKLVALKRKPNTTDHDLLKFWKKHKDDIF
mmetsp:Transcript_13313/g.29361  ORF Transcript_13313/g.29361 Transcript_13313/m.29361 type:complete len:86 (+) Transcript_13313:366-623(+)